MGILQPTVTLPKITAGTIGLTLGAEDNTSGTAYLTSDSSGFAHVDYALVGGTAISNSGAMIGPSTRILNLFPLNGITSVSIRRGRTRPDQYDDVGEMTVTVNNDGVADLAGQSDPDNASGRYQKLIASYGTALPISAISASAGTVTVTVGSAVSALTIGQAVAITGTTYYNTVAYVVGTTSTQFKFVSERTGTESAYTFSSATPFTNTSNKYSSWLQPGLWGRFSYQPTSGSAVNLFTGVLESAVPTDDFWSVATFTFVDRMSIIGRTKINAKTVGADGDTGAQRVNHLISLAGLWNNINYNGSATIQYEQPNTSYSGSFRDVKGFSKRLQRQEVKDSVLESLIEVCDGEAGRVFANADGIVCVYDRPNLQTLAGTVVATFSDTSSIAGLAYDEIHINQNQDYVYNKATVTYGSTIVSTATSDASMAAYGERAIEKTVVLSSASDQLAAAVFYATNWAEPKKTPISISLQTVGMSDADFKKVCNIDLGEAIRVVRQQPGGRQFDGTAVVEGIEVDFAPDNRRFTFYMSATDQAIL